jgi:hypothetical protein
MRLVKPGEKNWAVTEAVGKVAAAWGCKPVEGECVSAWAALVFFLKTDLLFG